MASLIGEPARAAILMALADGRALAAGTLAAEAHVAPSTASEHLARLVAGGLVTVEHSGRHRYFRLAAPEVAEAVEALARLAPIRPVRSLAQSTHAEALRRARTCYDHLAGRLGVALLEALAAGGLLAQSRCGDVEPDPVLGAGRAHRYHVTAAGMDRFAALDVNVEAPGRRPLIRCCVDWSEQRPHLAGWLGASLLSRMVEMGWLVPRPRRVVVLSDAGRRALSHELGVDVSVMEPQPVAVG